MNTLTTPVRTPTERRDAATTWPVARALARLGAVRVWVVVTAVYLAFAGVFFGSGAGFSIPHVQQVCGQAPPDMRFTSTAAQLHGFLDTCGTSGREAYRALQVADLFYPLLFAVVLASSLALVLRLLAPTHRNLVALAAIPFLAAAFDYLENLSAWLALAAWPEPGVADGMLGLFSAAKTATSWVAGTLLLVSLAALAVDRARALGARRRRGPAVEGGDRS